MFNSKFNKKSTIDKLKFIADKTPYIIQGIVVLSLIGAAIVLSVDVYQRNNPLPYVKAVDIEDPVKLDKNAYRIGEQIKGLFEGERYISRPTIFNRTLVCDEFRATLKPIRAEGLEVGKINDHVPLLRLQSSILIVPDIALEPAKNCEIIFSPLGVMRQYILGGEETQPDQSFRTDKFNILPREDV